MSILGLEMFVRIIKRIVVGGLARILLLRGWNFGGCATVRLTLVARSLVPFGNVLTTYIVCAMLLTYHLK